MRMQDITRIAKESNPKPRVKNGRERFVEVGIKRFQAAFDAIESLRNIGNRRNYFYTNGEAEDLIKALREELDEVEKVMVRRPISNVYDILGIEKPAKGITIISVE